MRRSRRNKKAIRKILEEKRKGQILSTDFVISAIIFFIILSMFLFSYNYTQEKHNEKMTQYRLYRESKAIGDIIVNLEGYPPSWDPENVKAIGCGNSHNILNSTKIHYLKEIPYPKLRKLLGLIGNDNFFINITFVNGTQYLSLGKNYKDGKIVTSSVRYGVLEINNKKEVVEVRVVMWI